MTKILPLKTLAVALCAMLALGPVTASAGPLLGVGLRVARVLEVSAEMGGQRWNKHHNDDNNNNNGDNSGDNNGGRWGGDNNGGGHRNGGGQQRDDRINRAIAIASSRGRVLDAWPMGGSMFGVRVATDRGRVDLTVDTDSGRIVDEH